MISHYLSFNIFYPFLKITSLIPMSLLDTSSLSIVLTSLLILTFLSGRLIFMLHIIGIINTILIFHLVSPMISFSVRLLTFSLGNMVSFIILKTIVKQLFHALFIEPQKYSQVQSSLSSFLKAQLAHMLKTKHHKVSLDLSRSVP